MLRDEQKTVERHLQQPANSFSNAYLALVWVRAGNGISLATTPAFRVKRLFSV